MYYCEPCADKNNLEKVFFQTYHACDMCGKWGVVFDKCKTYELSADAPCMQGKNPPVSKFAAGVFRVEIKVKTETRLLTDGLTTEQVVI